MRRSHPDSPEGRLDDLIETAKADIRRKCEHPIRVFKRQVGLEKIRLSGMVKNSYKVNVLAALKNLLTDQSIHGGQKLVCRT